MQATALRAVSNRHRREILKLVWSKELPAGDIAARFEISWPAISQNLKVLKNAGLVSERRDGKHRFYRADRAALRPLESVLRAMWEADLDRLGAVAEAEERRSRRARSRRR